MAEKDTDGPSLELPSLGFGRKRGRKAEATGPSVSEPAAPEPPSTPDPTPPASRHEPPPAEPAEPATQAAQATPATAPPSPLPEAADHPTEPLTAVREPEPASKPLFVDEVASEPDAHVIEPQPRKPRREMALPAIGTMPAAVITGLLVGVLTVGATWGSLRLCEVVRGTSSCGNPGFLVLIAIIVVMVLLGSAMLRAWRVPDPGSTSFLGVGLLTVLTLLFLVDVLFNWWMIIVIPVLAMLTFALARWVSTAFVEDE